MNLYLRGHQYQYAAEQILLTLFPDERPVYPQGKPAGERMELSLHEGAQYLTACCTLCRNGLVYHGRSAAKKTAHTDPILYDRVCQRLVKNAAYRAALASGMQRPPWGALTGVRPGKLFVPLLEQGLREQEALHRFMEQYDVTEKRAALCLSTSRHTLAARRSLGERDVCLYIGIPFCPTRCAYCSFVSQSVEKNIKLIEPFLTSLEQELGALAMEAKNLGLRVISLYFGGGTPTTLSAPQLDRLCSFLAEQFDLQALREYTVEAGRPDTISLDKLQVLRRHGVDRISVNPQTMEDRVLEIIGRHHTAKDIEAALSLVRQVGGFSVNMDLIAGLPGDDPVGFRRTMDTVLALAPENITVHTLSLKKGSRITLEGTKIPDGSQVSEMLDIAMEKLTAAGYAPYYLYRQKFMSGGFENVGWAKGDTANLYNICIMEELCSILAAGGGGSTKLIHPRGGRNIRLMAPKYPQEYISGIDKLCAGKAQITEFYLQEES